MTTVDPMLPVVGANDETVGTGTLVVKVTSTPYAVPAVLVA